MALGSGQRLDLAIGIFRLDPFGGLERHAVRLAEILAGREHRVTFYTTGPVDRVPSGVGSVAIARRGLSNHGRMARFGRAFAAAASGRHDLLVGFQKMPGLDVLFCADPCYSARPLPPLVALSPRARTMRALEAACFAPEAATRILALTERQAAAYRATFATPSGRIAVLPPTVDPRYRRRTRPGPDERLGLRRQLGLPEERTIWLWVGLQPEVKGLDRVLDALARHPEATLAICGAGRDTPGLGAMLRRAGRRGVGDRMILSGHVPDATLAGLFAAADLLIHPARTDVTGTVILEALASGLPVVASAACGYAPHITAADAGAVLPEPFSAADLDAALREASSGRRLVWSRNALAYAGRPELFRGLEKAADLIEAAAVPGAPAWQN